MKLTNTKLILIAVIFFTLGALAGYFINNPQLEIRNNSKEQNIQKEDVISILLNQFNDRYTAKTYLSGNSIITVASSNTSPEGREGGVDPYDKKASPLIIIVNKTTNKITALYEITFDAQNRSFGTGSLISQFPSSLINIDDDKELEFTSSWEIDWGGSGGLIGMVILKQGGDTYIPLTGYPSTKNFDKSKSDFVITNKLTNQRTILPMISTDSFSRFQDLNRDGRDEFLYAIPVWNYKIGDNFESHFDPHNWVLEVYEWNGKGFQIPKWWNDGKSYATTEKIQYFDNTTMLLTDFLNKTK